MEKHTSTYIFPSSRDTQVYGVVGSGSNFLKPRAFVYERCNIGNNFDYGNTALVSIGLNSKLAKEYLINDSDTLSSMCDDGCIMTFNRESGFGNYSSTNEKYTLLGIGTHRFKIEFEISGSTFEREKIKTSKCSILMVSNNRNLAMKLVFKLRNRSEYRSLCRFMEEEVEKILKEHPDFTIAVYILTRYIDSSSGFKAVSSSVGEELVVETEKSNRIIPNNLFCLKINCTCSNGKYNKC